MRLTTTVFALLMASGAGAQQIILPPGPIAPGSTFQVTLFNDTPGPIVVPAGNPLWMQHPDGSLIISPAVADYTFPLASGASISISFTVPAQGPGSNGSFVLRWDSVAVRLDVGAPSATFPAIHTNPFGHSMNPDNSGIYWEVSNTGATPHTFVAGDVVRIYSPGGTLPLLMGSLAGLVVPPHRSVTGVLSFGGLTPGPYTVEVTWTDPATNTVTSVRHGTQESSYTSIDAWLPGGHVIPSGGVLPVELFLKVYSDQTPLYAFCVGTTPGTTPVAGVGIFPLVYDAAVAASLTDGIGGLLIANVGYATPAFVQVFGFGWKASGIGITHPGAMFSGMVVRCAALGYEPGNAILMISQGEDLLIQ